MICLLIEILMCLSLKCDFCCVLLLWLFGERFEGRDVRGSVWSFVVVGGLWVVVSGGGVWSLRRIEGWVGVVDVWVVV